MPSTGLGAQHSNTGRWRSDMHSWQAAVQGRLQDLEGGAVSGSGRSSSGAARGVAAVGPAAGVQRQQPRPSPRQPAYVGGRGSGAVGRQAGAAGGAAARPAGGSKEDQDFDQRVSLLCVLWLELCMEAEQQLLCVLWLELCMEAGQQLLCVLWLELCMEAGPAKAAAIGRWQHEMESLHPASPQSMLTTLAAGVE